MKRLALPLLLLSGMALGLLGLRGAAVDATGHVHAADLFRAWGGGLLAAALLQAAAAWILSLRKDGLAFLTPKARNGGEKKASHASIKDFALSGIILFLLSFLAQYAIPALLG